MFNISNLYTWEIETEDGVVYKQFDEEGNERSSKDIDSSLVKRISFVPALPLRQRHDCIIDRASGHRFLRRFCSKYMKMNVRGGGGFQLAEVASCAETNRFRMFVVHSTGKVIVSTNSNFELNL